MMILILCTIAYLACCSASHGYLKSYFKIHSHEWNPHDVDINIFFGTVFGPVLILYCILKAVLFSPASKLGRYLFEIRLARQKLSQLKESKIQLETKLLEKEIKDLEKEL